ncbi:hypothetical protein NP173_23855 [Salmonella enterica]|nr:hypothetical protein [Salmonella enterica]
MEKPMLAASREPFELLTPTRKIELLGRLANNPESSPNLLIVSFMKLIE